MTSRARMALLETRRLRVLATRRSYDMAERNKSRSFTITSRFPFSRSSQDHDDALRIVRSSRELANNGTLKG